MSNIKSATKRVEISERNRLRNKAYKSTVKTLIKKTVLAMTNLNASNIESVKRLLSLTYSKIDKSVQKGIIHSNTGYAKKSKLIREFKKQETHSQVTK